MKNYKKYSNLFVEIDGKDYCCVPIFIWNDTNPHFFCFNKYTKISEILNIVFEEFGLDKNEGHGLTKVVMSETPHTLDINENEEIGNLSFKNDIEYRLWGMIKK